MEIFHKMIFTVRQQCTENPFLLRNLYAQVNALCICNELEQSFFKTHINSENQY